MVIALNAQTMFSRLVAGTLSLTFFVYIFVNMGMVSGICRWLAHRCHLLAMAAQQL